VTLASMAPPADDVCIALGGEAAKMCAASPEMNDPYSHCAARCVALADMPSERWRVCCSWRRDSWRRLFVRLAALRRVERPAGPDF